MDPEDLQVDPDLHEAPAQRAPNVLKYPDFAFRRDLEGARLHFLEEAAALVAPAPGGARWETIGPANMSGRIKCLAIHPENDQIVYAGSASGGVWKTDDGGGSWAAKMEKSASLAIGSIDISRGDPRILVVGTGENSPGWRPSYPGEGVLWSLDGGETWGPASKPPEGGNRRSSRVLLDQNDPRTVYVAGDIGLFRGFDYGAKWEMLLPGHASDLVMAREEPDAPYTLYLALWNCGVWRSRSQGADWELLDRFLPVGGDADWIKLAAGGTPGHLIAKMGNDSGQLFETRDGGDTWNPLPGVHQPSDMNEWTSLVAIHPHDPRILFVGGPKLKRSEDGGRVFEIMNGGHEDYHAMVFSHNLNGPCYVANDGGVALSSDRGKTWRLRNTGLVTTQFFSIAAHGPPGEAGYVMGMTQDRGLLTLRDGMEWTEKRNGMLEDGILVVDPHSDGRTLYITHYRRPPGHNLIRSDDRGVNHHRVMLGLENEPPPVTTDPEKAVPMHPDVRDVAVSGVDRERLLCASNRCVFLHTRMRLNAEGKLEEPWTPVLAMNGDARRVLFSRAEPAVCFAVSDEGELFRSEKDGAPDTWNLVGAPPAGLVMSFVASGSDPEILYLAYATFARPPVYRSRDRGATWETAETGEASGLPRVPVNALLVHPREPATIFAATDIGVFATTDRGDHWAPLPEGLPNVVVSSLAVREATDGLELFAGTMGRGIYRMAL